MNKDAISTPRTDAAFQAVIDGQCLPKCDSYGHEELCPYANGDAVMAEFARTLEREIAALKQSGAKPKEGAA